MHPITSRRAGFVAVDLRHVDDVVGLAHAAYCHALIPQWSDDVIHQPLGNSHSVDAPIVGLDPDLVLLIQLARELQPTRYG